MTQCASVARAPSDQRAEVSQMNFDEIVERVKKLLAGNSINIGGNNPGLSRPAYGIGNQAMRLTNKG